MYPQPIKVFTAVKITFFLKTKHFIEGRPKSEFKNLLKINLKKEKLKYHREKIIHNGFFLSPFHFCCSGLSRFYIRVFMC